MSRPVTPLTFSSHAGPSSPPETPTTSNFTFGETSHATKRHGTHNFSRPFAPINGNIKPVGQGPQYRYNPSVRPEDISPRSCSPDSDTSGTQPRSVSSDAEPSEDESQNPIKKETIKVKRIVTQGNFTIRELRAGDVEYDSDDALSVVQPDHYEDADSDAAHSHTTQPLPKINTLDPTLMEDFDRLDCNNATVAYEVWQQKQREAKRNKRLSSGSIHKRTLSQSIGSGTDDEDIRPFDANEAGSSARRLRRKTGDLASIIFDDPPRIVEELEPESDDDIGMQIVEPDVDDEVIDVEEVLMHALPYYQQHSDDSMEVDSKSEADSNSDSESDSNDL